MTGDRPAGSTKGMDFGDPRVVAAIIAAAVSVLAAIASVALTIVQNAKARALERELEDLRFARQKEAKEDEWQLAAREQLDEIRVPLLETTRDVEHRLGNIRTNHFLAYLNADEHRSRTTIITTTFRLAQYWGVVEFLYGNISQLRFEADEETRDVAQVVKSIGETFATDKLDQGRLMMWREEQRAVGELMMKGSRRRSLQLLGFASFTESYNEKFARWFDQIESDLRTHGIEHSQRLEKLQGLFAKLSDVLSATGPEPSSRSAKQVSTDEVRTRS